MSSIQISVISSNSDLESLLLPWEKLWSEASEKSTPLHPLWVYEWWKVYGIEGDLRLLLAQESSGRIVGVFPLYLEKGRWYEPRVLRLVSDSKGVAGTYPEYVGPLLHSTMPQEVRTLFAQKIFSLDWDEFHYGIHRDHDFMAVELLATHQDEGGTFHSSPLRAALMVAPEGFESFLESASSDRRKRFRRILRDGEVKKTYFQIAKDAEEALGMFDRLVKLHQARWNNVNESGAFSDEAKLRFHRALIESLMDRGQLCLSELSVQGVAIAHVYGFQVGDRFEAYQSSTEQNSLLQSPGVLAHLLTFKHLARRGVTEYDFLVGESEYKRRLASSYRPMRDLTLERKRVSSRIRSFLSRGIHRYRELFRQEGSDRECATESTL